MSVAMSSYDGARGSARCRAAPASDRTTDNSASHGAASGGALCHGIRYRHSKSQHEQKR
jgi:hypothetical protein